MNRIAPYAKTVVAIAGAVLTAILTQFPDNDTVQQWGPIVSALLTALTVYAVPNRAPEPPEEGGQVDLVTIYYVLASVFFVVATLWLVGVGTRAWVG